MILSRNKKGKVSSKTLNEMTRGPKSMGIDSIPLSNEIKLVDPAHVCMIHAKAENPIFGVESEYGIEPSQICDVFKDGDEFDVKIDGDRLILSRGKDEYWFRLYVYDDVPPRLPTLKLSTRFNLDTQKVTKAAKDNPGALAGRIRAGYDKNGNKTVWLFVYGEDNVLLEGINLGVPWVGMEAVTSYPMEYLKNVGKFADRMDVGFTTDEPLKGDYSSEGRDMEYLLAPRILSSDDFDWEANNAAEEKWIASHNRRKTGNCKNCKNCGKCGKVKSANAKAETIYYFKGKAIGNIIDMEDYIYSNDKLLDALCEDYDLDIFSGPYDSLNKGVIGELLYDLFERPYIEGQEMYGISCKQPVNSYNSRGRKK